MHVQPEVIRRLPGLTLGMGLVRDASMQVQFDGHVVFMGCM
jgi:hypothetical protein